VERLIPLGFRTESRAAHDTVQKDRSEPNLELEIRSAELNQKTVF
jgi:hypothetical protein